MINETTAITRRRWISPPAMWNTSQDRIQITKRNAARIKKKKSRKVDYAHQMESRKREKVSENILIQSLTPSGRQGTEELFPGN